jgi:phosphatidylserine/phosphatidylglycerophosphate/cardiolipin synthase-like enzyme
VTDFEVQDSQAGFTMKLWRGERMCLLGFDVADPEPDFVGFAIERRRPDEREFDPLPNRLAFSYDREIEKAVTGKRLYSSIEAPFQKFRWIHFPDNPRPGVYTYRATKMHMPVEGPLRAGTSIELQIPLDPVTYADFLDVGFTRGFASSQAFTDRFAPGTNLNEAGQRLIPDRADDGLGFQKMSGDIYSWLGFEAYDLLMGFLDDVLQDATIDLDVFAFDLNEPDIVEKLRQIGSRLRIIIDDSSDTDDGVKKGHGAPTSAESQAAEKLSASAGPANVKRTHFAGLQHQKVFIARREGRPFKVLAGSTNFSFRGIYIQSNSVLVFQDPSIAGFFGRAFDEAFRDPRSFKASPSAAGWNTLASAERPPVRVIFSPHQREELSLGPVGAAIAGATSSVFFAVAFLNQIRSGEVKQALEALSAKPIFSYGVVNQDSGLSVKKPDGSIGTVDFGFLGTNAPEPFGREWRGGKGINVHHKFVVTDFNLPTAKVFTGSHNLSPAAALDNGDNLFEISDCRVATAYAIEALRLFDHLHFRSHLQEALEHAQDADGKRKLLTLQKPTALSGEAAWFERFYVAGSQLANDRQLFSH